MRPAGRCGWPSSAVADGEHTGTVRVVSGQEGYRPGLDGIRALAVAAVLWFHLDRLPGGNLGVDAFFVVSGWLITWKLLDEADRTGTIALPRFWAARVRRLLPASVAVLLVVAIVWPLAGIDVPSLRRDLLFAAGWSSNWGTISAGGDYWARFGEPSPVTHFWSLAIEEQFYLVWPIVLAVLVRIGRRRRAFVGAFSLAAAIGSMVAMNVMFDPTDATATYMNTLARAHSLLVGAAAAAVTVTLPDGRLRGGGAARRVAPFAAAGAVAIVIAVSVAGRGADNDWMFSWGFPAFAIAMVPVVVAAADGGGERVLASRPMRWVADRSYGLYLWHWPVFLLLTPDRLGVADRDLPIAVLDVCRVAVAVVLADLSLRWLETPVRRRERLRTWRAPIAAGLALSAVVVVAVTVVPSSPATSSESVVTLPPPSTTAPPDAATASTTAPEVASMGPPPGPRTTVDPGVTAEPTAEPIADPAMPAVPAVPAVPVVALGRPLRVLVTGDSTALHLSEALIAHATTVPDEFVVGSGAFPGCGLSAGADGRMHVFTDVDGQRDLIDLSGCLRQWESVPQRVNAEAVDVVLVEIGAWDAVDIRLPDGSVVSVADPVGRAIVADAYQRFAETVTSAGASVLWVTPPDAHLGWGTIDDPLNDPLRWDALREIIDGLGSGVGVIQVDLPTWLVANGLDGPEGRPDGVHLAPGINERFVAELVAPALAAIATTIATTPA